jgi:hypothetical protein
MTNFDLDQENKISKLFLGDNRFSILLLNLFGIHLKLG